MRYLEVMDSAMSSAQTRQPRSQQAPRQRLHQTLQPNGSTKRQRRNHDRNESYEPVIWTGSLQTGRSRLLDGGVEERAFVMDIYTGNVILTTIYSYILYVTCCLLSLSSYHIVTIIYSHLYIYHFLPLAIVVRIEALRH